MWKLSEIDISRDQKGYAEMAKKHSDVSTIVDLFNQWKNIVQEIKDAEELMEVETDEDMKQDFEDIILLNKPQLDPLIQKIKISLYIKMPTRRKRNRSKRNTRKNVTTYLSIGREEERRTQ